MSETQWFEVAHWLTLILPVAIAGGVFLLPRPRRAWLRAPLAIVAGWTTAILLTAFVYNPAGIAYGHALGEHFPEARFGNGTIASMLLFGWIYPAVMCGVMAVVRLVRLRVQRVP